MVRLVHYPAEGSASRFQESVQPLIGQASGVFGERMVIAVHEEAELVLLAIQPVYLIKLNANSGQELLIAHGSVVVGRDVAPGPGSSTRTSPA